MDKFGSLTLEERPTSSSSKASEEAPEVPLEETLAINKRGRAYLKNVSINAENPALVIGWYDDRIDLAVQYIIKHRSSLPEPPEFLDISEELTALTFKDSIHMELSELGDGGSFSNIIAPCTLDEVMEMVFLLGSLQRHPFLQAVLRELGCGPLAVCGTCLDSKTCEVIPLKLFVPPSPSLQVFA